MPNWLLKEYAVVLADLNSSVLNSTFNEQKRPSSWKLANVIPLSKQKTVTDLNKHLRLISLTPSISKVAEDFVVTLFVGPAVLEAIYPNQFGAVPKSSTVQALISMIHRLAQATDGSEAAARLVLFDYRKAFDLIDHTLLVQNIYRLAIPRGIARCLLMINNLKVSDVSSWKYVDDTCTSVAEVMPGGSCNQVQCAADEAMHSIINSKHAHIRSSTCTRTVLREHLYLLRVVL